MRHYYNEGKQLIKFLKYVKEIKTNDNNGSNRKITPKTNRISN